MNLISLILILQLCQNISKRINTLHGKKRFKHDVDFTFLYNPYFVALGDVLDGLENPDFVLLDLQTIAKSY